MEVVHLLPKVTVIYSSCSSSIQPRLEEDVSGNMYKHSVIQNIYDTVTNLMNFIKAASFSIVFFKVTPVMMPKRKIPHLCSEEKGINS